MTIETVIPRDDIPAFRRSPIDRLVWKLRDAFWEWRFNVRTAGALNWDPNLSDSRYATLPYKAFFAMLDAVQPTADDVIVDIGCGKGRFLACASALPVKKVVGVEINEPLAAMARANLARMRRRKARFDIVTAPAQDVDLSHGSVFYVYDAFGPGILRAVLDNLRAAVDAGRNVRFIYASPRHEGVLRECGWLERYDAWPPRPDHANLHAVSFWRAIPRERAGARGA